MRHTRPPRIRIALPIAATAAAMLAALLPAATAAEPGLTVTSVSPQADWGGYPSISWGWQGGLYVEISDATPRDRHDYVATVTPAAGGEPVTARVETYRGWDGGSATALVGAPGDFERDVVYDVSVAELDGDTLVESSEPVAFTPTAVGHPSNAELRKKGRKRTVKVGSVVRIRWTGDWEEGIHLTQVVAARPTRGTFSTRQRDFLVCENSYCPTRRGTTRYVRADDNSKVTRFRVPRRFAGKTLVIDSHGTQGDQVRNEPAARTQWGWTWTFKVRRG